MRAAVFGDLFHVPEWRLCAVAGCPEVVHRPAWFCAPHSSTLWAPYNWPPREPT